MSRQYPQAASRLILIAVFLISLGVESVLRGRSQPAKSKAAADSGLVTFNHVAHPFLESWARKILTTKESGRGPPMIRQWSYAPSISVVGGNDAQRSLVYSAMHQLNRTLEHTRIGKIRLTDRPGPSDVTVYFESREANHKRTGRNGVFGCFAIEVDSFGVISRGWIHIVNDSTLHEQRCAVLEELTQVLGFLNDSSEVCPSIFYEAVEDPGFMDEISEIDRKLIWFSYNFLNPGDTWSVVLNRLNSCFSNELEATPFPFALEDSGRRKQGT